MAALYQHLGVTRIPATKSVAPTWHFEVHGGGQGKADIMDGNLRVHGPNGLICEVGLDEWPASTDAKPIIDWLRCGQEANPSIIIGVRALAGDACVTFLYQPRTGSLHRLPGYAFGPPQFLKGLVSCFQLWGPNPYRSAGLRAIDSYTGDATVLFEDATSVFSYRLLPCIEERGALLIGKSTDDIKVGHFSADTRRIDWLTLPAHQGPVMALATGDRRAIFIALSTNKGLHLYKLALDYMSNTSLQLLWVDSDPHQYLFAIALTRFSVLLITGRDASPRLRAIDRNRGSCRETALPINLDGCMLSLQDYDPDDRALWLQIESPFLPPVAALWIPEDGLCFLPDESLCALAQVHYETLSFTTSDGVPLCISLWYRAQPVKSCQDLAVVGCYGAYGRPPPLMYNAWLERSSATSHVLVHVRGGGDRGVPWHESGRGRYRSRAVADFAEAITWLHARGTLHPARTVLNGRSAGCIAVGAVLATQPQWAAGAVLEYPFLDLIGTLDEGDWLSTAEQGEWLSDGVKLDDLRACCPTHSLTSQSYPPVLILAGGRDWRSPLTQICRWYDAYCRANVRPESTPIIRIEEGAGHGLAPHHPSMSEICSDVDVFMRGCLSRHEPHGFGANSAIG